MLFNMVPVKITKKRYLTFLILQIYHKLYMLDSKTDMYIIIYIRLVS